MKQLIALDRGSSAAQIFRRRPVGFRNACLICTALSGSLAFHVPANGQAFNGTPGTQAGSVVYNRATPGTETTTINSATATILWLPLNNGIDFLPSGNTAIFQGAPGNGNFEVLNRINQAAAGPITLDGNIVSRISTLNTNAGGTIGFAAVQGQTIAVGPNANFDANRIRFQQDVSNPARQQVTWNGTFLTGSSGGGLLLQDTNFTATSGAIGKQPGFILTFLDLQGSTFNLGNTSLGLDAVQMTNSEFSYAAGGAGSSGSLSQTFVLTGANTIGTLNQRSLTLSGVISGAGELGTFGTGTTILTATNSYGGGTRIFAGTLQLGDGGTTGSIVGNVVNNARLAFNRSNAYQFDGVISGSGAVNQIGSGTTTLTAANTYTGVTTISSGALNIQNATALGSTAAGTIVASGAALQLSGANLVVGAEALTLNGTGVANDGALRNLSGLNVYNGAITLGSASRINADGGQIGLPGGITTAGFDIAFGGAGNIVANSLISGTGNLVKDGAGTLALGAANSFSGTTTINGGVIFAATNNVISASSGLLINAGEFDLVNSTNSVASLAGAGTVRLRFAPANLVVGSGNANTDYAGVIYGIGTVVKTGTGTQGLSGINTYTGITTINGGTLAVNGSIASSSLTTVNAGGTLGGTGTVGTTTINGGTLAPGNSIGTLNVTGNLTFTAASSYMIEVSPTTSDRTNVTGTATLGGATVNASFANGGYLSKQYTIVNATGGRIGTFGAIVTTNLPANATSSLSYDANNAYLNLALSFTPPTAPNFGGGLNQNQQNVANALVNSFNVAGGIPMAFASLSPAGLTQVSGELGVGTQQASFDAMSLFMGVLTDPTNGNRDAASAQQGGAIGYADEALSYAARRSPSDAMAAIYRKAPPLIAAPLQRWSVWSAGFGGSQTTNGNAVVGSNTATSRVFGGAVGVDYRFSPDTVAGVALAGGGTNFSVANSGTGRSDLFQAGAFVRHNTGATYLSAALAYGWQDVTTDRSVGADRLTARFNTNTLAGRIEGGYRFVDPTFAMGITPYAAGQFTTVYLPNYGETSGVGNIFGLNFAAKDVTASRSELGVRTDKSFGVVDGVITLRGRAAWAHNFNPDRSVNATFQTLPGASFVVNGAAQAREAALVTASAEMKWRSGWAVAATFEGEFSDVTRSYAGKGVVRYGW